MENARSPLSPSRSHGRASGEGVAFLAAGALAAANVWNGLRPIPERGLVRLLTGFGAGLVTSELPLLVLAAQGTLAAAALRRLDARDPAVQGGMVLAAGAAGGLGVLHRRALGAGAVLDAALDEGLGADRRQREVRPTCPVEAGEPAPSPGLVRMMRVRARYAHAADIQYGSGSPRTRLDIWRRPDVAAAGGAPVLLQVHGGGWMYGNKRGQAYPLMAHLAERGWLCISIGYPLSPAATWPDQIVAVKQALAWIKTNVSQYGGDPSFVAITGGSAGGHLAALTALTPRDPTYQPGFEDVDTSVQAVVPFYGVYDWTNREGGYSLVQPFIERHVVKQRPPAADRVLRQASPVHRVGPEAPPTFLLHGTNDSLVPVAGARALAAGLRAQSRAPVVYAELPGAQHAFDLFSSVRARAVAVAVESFLATVYGDHRKARRR
jgi:acetyl esterase/lipase